MHFHTRFENNFRIAPLSLVELSLREIPFLGLGSGGLGLTCEIESHDANFSCRSYNSGQVHENLGGLPPGGVFSQNGADSPRHRFHT